MAEPRPEKVAIVEDVQARLDETEAAILTEYRGLDVPAIAELRSAVREAGGEYKVYKNTMVRFAARNLDLDIDDLLVGPTAIAFVTTKPMVRQVTRPRSRRRYGPLHVPTTTSVVKGAVLGRDRLSADDTNALADLPSREVLIAQIAGGINGVASGLRDGRRSSDP